MENKFKKGDRIIATRAETGRYLNRKGTVISSDMYHTKVLFDESGFGSLSTHKLDHLHADSMYF